MKKTIKTYDDLVDWAKRGNFCRTDDHKKICDLQDEYGTSNANELEEIIRYSIDKGDRSVIVFSIHKIMGDSYLERYVKIWGQQVARKQYDLDMVEIEAKMKAVNDFNNQVNKKFNTLHDCRKAIYKKIEQLNKRIALLDKKKRDLFTELQHAHSTNRYLEKRINKFEGDANKWAEFRTMLNLPVERISS